MTAKTINLRTACGHSVTVTIPKSKGHGLGVKGNQLVATVQSMDCPDCQKLHPHAPEGKCWCNSVHQSRLTFHIPA